MRVGLLKFPSELRNHWQLMAPERGRVHFLQGCCLYCLWETPHACVDVPISHIQESLSGLRIKNNARSWEGKLVANMKATRGGIDVDFYQNVLYEYMKFSTIKNS